MFKAEQASDVLRNLRKSLSYHHSRGVRSKLEMWLIGFGTKKEKKNRLKF